LARTNKPILLYYQLLNIFGKAIGFPTLKLEKMKETILHSFFIIIACTITISTQAQQFTFEQCIDYALEHNRSIAGSKLNVDLQRETWNQSKRDILPYISGSVQSDVMFGKSIDPTTNDFVNERLFSSNFYIGAEVSLFKGLTQRNRMVYEKLQFLIASERDQQEKINTTFAVMTNYYNVLYHKLLMVLADEQVRLSEKQLKKAELLVKTGLKPSTEILEMDAHLAGEKHNAVQIENLLHEALLNLKNSMNYPIEDSIEIVDSFNFVSGSENPTIEDIYAKACDAMPTGRIAHLAVEAQKRELKIARGQLSPTLSIGAAYSTFFADSRKETLPNDPDRFRTIALQSQLDQNGSENIYVSLRIPIFQKWQRMSQIQKEKLKLELAVNQHDIAVQDLYRQIMLDIQQLNSYKAEILQLEKKKNAEQQALEIIEKKLDKGIISVLEYYTAKNNLMKTEAELLRAKTMLMVKKHTIDIYTKEQELL